jgi:hypothetical protein
MRLPLALMLFSTLALADEPPTPAPSPQKVDELQKEYERIRESLFTARARAAAVGAAMYSSKVQIFLKFGTPRFFHVGRGVIRLDGASVYEDAAGAIGNDDLIRFEGFVAPGKHLITVRFDSDSKDDASFSSSTESTFIIDVPQHKLVTLRAQAEDGGDMGSTFPKKGKGSYRLHLDADVETKDMPVVAASPPTAPPPAPAAPDKPDKPDKVDAPKK